MLSVIRSKDPTLLCSGNFEGISVKRKFSEGVYEENGSTLRRKKPMVVEGSSHEDSKFTVVHVARLTFVRLTRSNKCCLEKST